MRLAVIATPGHSADHLCFVAPDQGVVFTGDHLAQSAHATRLSDAPGAMDDFIAALDRLQAVAQSLGVTRIAPGHGFLMAPLVEMVARAHTDRVGRENRVLRALRESTDGYLDDLVEIACHDIDAPSRVRWRETVLAHLSRLDGEGRARREDEGRRWRLR
jgi:glyoxylase-like metal-dependent hydrolase (beta-lactamase superfamily II)